MKEREYIKELVNAQKYLASKIIEDELSIMAEKASTKNEDSMTTLAQVFDFLENSRTNKEKND